MAETQEEMMAGVADLVRSLRLSAGLTQRQMAELVGSPQGQVCLLEKGRNDVKVGTILKYANALDMDLWIVVTDPSEEIKIVSKSVVAEEVLADVPEQQVG